MSAFSKIIQSRFIGTHEELPSEKSSWKPLIERGEVIGAVVRSRTNVKPIYVSLLVFSY
jgi:deoxyribonuclease V